ncbi:hypothetical protein BGZ61DRAFT_229725 [Ilyonectria robusta]|uniref:uncharacterized protein n=1 Tax=Ilyonectria robusta TaxID=1079257 RepID=UPI001E8DF0A6|nr:uncharacterized protein BGZ61DRAFT_229725 [Ilyonectria robusta]KAH8651720.1 hypothetical protein BGZ61DRAFT_229725 [Ilyonectria robusta]
MTVPTLVHLGPSSFRRSSSYRLLPRHRLRLETRTALLKWYAFAEAALDRTQSAFANISEPLIRPQQSNGAVARLFLLPSSNPSSEPTDTKKNNQLKSPSNQSLSSVSWTAIPLTRPLRRTTRHLSPPRPQTPSARLHSRFLARRSSGLASAESRIAPIVSGNWAVAG